MIKKEIQAIEAKLSEPTLAVQLKEANEINEKISILEKYHYGLVTIVSAVEDRELINNTILDKISSVLPTDVTFKSINITSLIIIISCLLLWLFLNLIIFILNKKANNSILFEEKKMLYKNRTLYSNNVSIKYFKFHISIIEPSLVIPKIHINGNNLSVTCYLSKKDIKKLKKMNFEIKEI